MNDLTISIFGNKNFLEIVNELNLFPGSNVSFVDNINVFMDIKADSSQIAFFFITEDNKKDFLKIQEKTNPIVVITSPSIPQNHYSGDFIEQINMPFKILSFKKKIVSLLAKYDFKKSSLINLGDYVIDKNERKLKKNGLELKLTEKETNFLVLFSQKNKPLSRDFILKSVWKYSLESDTHTVETHIHRLRKKILEKFNDNNFIKNNTEGYFI